MIKERNDQSQWTLCQQAYQVAASRLGIVVNMLPTELYMAAFAAFIFFDSTRIPALACLAVVVTGYQYEDLPDYAYETYYLADKWAYVVAGALIAKRYPRMAIVMAMGSLNAIYGYSLYMSYEDYYKFTQIGFTLIVLQILLLCQLGMKEIQETVYSIVDTILRKLGV